MQCNAVQLFSHGALAAASLGLGQRYNKIATSGVCSAAILSLNILVLFCSPTGVRRM